MDFVVIFLSSLQLIDLLVYFKHNTDAEKTARQPKILLWFVSLVLLFFTSLCFHFQLPFSTISTLHHSPVLLFLLCCCFSGPHFRPIPSFSRTSGNISRQTDHLGVRPVNVLIVIYSWTEFKKSFSLLTTWSWGPEKKKKSLHHFFLLKRVRRSQGFCQPQILMQF